MNNTGVTGYSALTPLNLLIDSGAIYSNYGKDTEKLVSATSGGNEFEVKIDTRDIKVDGIKSDAKGLKRITKITVTLKTNLLEATSENLAMLVFGNVDTVSDIDYDIITGKNYIADTDYLENIAIVGSISGSLKPVIVVIKNALSTDGLSMQRGDDDDNVLPLTITGHVDPSTPELLPYEIRYPKVGALAPLYVVGNPIVDSGAIRLDFNTDVVSPVPFTGFTVLVDTVANAVTASTRNINDLSIVNLTLTTPLTSGQVVTVAYTKSVTVEEQVTAVTGGTLATFGADTVTNN